MKPDSRLLWGSIGVAVVCFATAFGVNVFYNEAHEARGLDSASFQVLVMALFACTGLAVLTATWVAANASDEVVRAGDRVSVYWGWTIGVFVWFMTPWFGSLPEALVDPFSNPNGDTLFTLSEADGAYMGGGIVLILIVSTCSAIIKVWWRWWLAKQ